MKRRSFLKIGFGSTIGLVMSDFHFSAMSATAAEPRFKISLAQWSLNKSFFGETEPKLDNLERNPNSITLNLLKLPMALASRDLNM